MRIARRLLLALGLLAAILVLGVFPRLVGIGPRLPLTRTPADVGLAFESVTFHPPGQSLTLRAWWIPAKDAKAAVVLVHGGGQDNRAVPFGGGLELMRALVARRYAVLALDLRNYGESDASPDGEATFGPREADDVRGAVAFVAAKQLRTVALGFSAGGATALYAAARDPRVEAVVTDGTFAVFRDILPRAAHAATEIPNVLLRPILWSAEVLHRRPLVLSRPVEAVAALGRRPLLVIHNDADPIVPIEHARRLVAAAAHGELWLTPAPSGDHPALHDAGAWGTHIRSYRLDPDAYVERIVTFCDASLG